MAGAREYGTRELATPLASTSQPAGPLQQVMSPTLWQGYAVISPPAGRDGLQQTGLTPTPVHGQSGGMGFEPNVATGGALDQHEPSGGSGGMPPGSTTITGGDVAHHVVQMPDASPGARNCEW